MNTPKEGKMIKQVYVKKNGTVWRLSISSWLGICKDGAKGAGYALPDECVVAEGMEGDADSLMMKIDGWHASDFEEFIRAYQLGNIKPPKVELVVTKQVQAVKEPEPVPVVEEKPKVKKAAAKKPRAKK